jgi:hypothetical protein
MRLVGDLVLPKRSGISEAVAKGMDMASEGPPLKIAILLTTSPDLREIRRAAELSSAVTRAETALGHSVEVTVGIPEQLETKWRFAEQQIRRRVPGTVVRRMEWARVPVKNARRMFANLPETLDLEDISEVAIPHDWGWNFQDCDLWISMARARVGAILPLRPMTQYCSDLAQRYVPTSITGSIHDPYWNLETDAFRMWRQSLVITSDQDTAIDLVSYAGVRRERIEVVPDVLDSLPPIMVREQERDPFLLLWLLTGNGSDELETGLQALSAYFRERGNFEVLMAHDVGAAVNTHVGVAALGPDLLKLYQDLPRFPYRSLEELDRMLARSGAVWSSQSAGGEGEHVHDAARAGLPLIAPRFGLNERTAERSGADALFYPLDDALAITDGLHELEERVETDQFLPGKRVEADAQEQRIDWGFAVDRMLEHANGR